MRIYIYFIVSLLFLSCQLDVEEDNFHLEKIPVFDIQVPDNLVVNFEYTISFKYALTNGCYTFYEKDYNIISDTTREITALAKVANNEICTQEYSEEICTFPFKPTESKTYIFKFWIGLNDIGIDEFEEFELVVE